jgi:hypothetical protein
MSYYKLPCGKIQTFEPLHVFSLQDSFALICSCIKEFPWHGQLFLFDKDHEKHLVFFYMQSKHFRT